MMSVSEWVAMGLTTIHMNCSLYQEPRAFEHNESEYSAWTWIYILLHLNLDVVIMYYMYMYV